MTDQVTPVPAPWEQTTDLLLRWTPSVQMSTHHYLAMHSLCAAMAQWLTQQHGTDWPDDHVVLESRNIDGAVTCRITAGMIREANR